MDFPTVHKTVYSMEDMKDVNIIYITDVEGNYTYFEHMIRISKGLYRDEEGNLDLRPKYHFVYGGDVCDRGKGDLRITSDIVKLAKRHAGKVHLILGNRDINKIRLCTELKDEQLKKKLKVYWINDDDIKEPPRDASMPPCTRAMRLHTILECTMGAPEAFDNRVGELTEMGVITKTMGRVQKDNLVVDSFVESMRPGGCMSEFLRLGCLAVLLGDVFFFHGGVHERALGWVPPSSRLPQGRHAHSVQDWCHGLAAFHLDEITSLLRSQEMSPICPSSSSPSSANRTTTTDLVSEIVPTFSALGGYDHPDPASRLMQYGMGNLPDGSVNPTICYDCFLVSGAPEAPSEKVVSFLNNSSVTRTVTGHQPHGDAPLIVTTPALQVITGDTSYAQNVKWDFEYSPGCSSLCEQLKLLTSETGGGGEGGGDGAHDQADTRGFAVSEIVISFTEECLPTGQCGGGSRSVVEEAAAPENEGVVVVKDTLVEEENSVENVIITPRGSSSRNSSRSSSRRNRSRGMSRTKESPGPPDVHESDASLGGNAIRSSLMIHGVTQEQLPYEFTANEFIGRRTSEGWWVKTLLHLHKRRTSVPVGEGQHAGDSEKIGMTAAAAGGGGGGGGEVENVYMISRSEGRNVLNALISEEELKGRLV